MLEVASNKYQAFNILAKGLPVKYQCDTILFPGPCSSSSHPFKFDWHVLFNLKKVFTFCIK